MIEAGVPGAEVIEGDVNSLTRRRCNIASACFVFISRVSVTSSSSRSGGEAGPPQKCNLRGQVRSAKLHRRQVHGDAEVAM